MPVSRVTVSGPAPAVMPDNDPLASLRNGFHARRKVFKLLGAEVRVSDFSGRLVCMARQRAFKLKEDIRLYADEAATQEVLTIRARQVIDFSATYDVYTAGGGSVRGSLRRKGWSSLLRDQWEIWNPREERIGGISEDSMALALARRFLGAGLVPQRLDFEIGGKLAGTYRGHFNPFVFKGDWRPVGDEHVLDPSLALAAVVLYLCLEGRQD